MGLSRSGLLLLALLGLSACATRSAVGGAGWAAERTSEPEARARQAEAERVVGEMWAVAGGTEAPGAAWQFRYHSQGGALTLRSFRRLEEPRGRGAPLDRGAFLPGFLDNLPTLVGLRPREVTFTLVRQQEGWEAGLGTEGREAAPPEARTLPWGRQGVSPDTYRQVVAAARSLARLLEVPRGGRARLEVEVALEDDRITGLHPGRLEASGRSRLPASERTVEAVVSALLPFTYGLGSRTVRLVLEGTHREQEVHPRWRGVEAETLRPPPPPEEMEDFAHEYRAMHERILREWREQTRESAVLLAGWSLEQAASWYVGGLLLRGGLVLFEAAAPTLVSVLSKGGMNAVRWFRALLIRMPSAERAVLERLWLKAETQGLGALTAAERAELRALMGRMEQLIHTPLKDKRVKNDLREWARKEYFEVHNPGLAQALGDEGMQFYSVHHVIPLEYTHLFPKLEANARSNLVGVAKPVHEDINRVWNAVRRASQRITPEQVEGVAALINKHFNRWYDVIYDPAKSAGALDQAKQAALRDVTRFLNL